MKQKIKLIGFDLDGTLLNSEKKIGLYTRKVLDACIERGITVLPVTGRPFSGVPKELRGYCGMDYMITSNGARVVEKGISVYEKLLPVEKARKILDIFGDYDTLREIYYDGQGYAQKSYLDQISVYMKTSAMAEYVLTTRIAVDNIEKKFSEENRPLDKVQALFVREEEREAAWERIEALGDVEVTGALSNNIEVNAAGVHKGIALLWLAKKLGISREEVMAFGDGTNDLKMLQTVGVGIAMENAVDSVKAVADDIAPSNDEEGVAQIIEKYVLNT